MVVSRCEERLVEWYRYALASALAELESLAKPLKRLIYLLRYFACCGINEISIYIYPSSLARCSAE